jgi:hypothetical protein
VQSSDVLMQLQPRVCFWYTDQSRGILKLDNECVLGKTAGPNFALTTAARHFRLKTFPFWVTLVEETAANSPVEVRHSLTAK